MAAQNDKSKLSYGIACCRINNGRPEILLVYKRYTYAFQLFVAGKYNPNNNSSISRLLDKMTVDEKLDILSLNFQQMWYRIFLDSPMMIKSNTYYSAKNKFETAFVPDRGQRIRKLINRSANVNRVWEIPKGRKRAQESDIQSAVREFDEETGINKKQYRIYPWFVRSYSYIDESVKYVNKYFLAIAKTNIEPHIQFNFQEQLNEISDIRWMNIDEIRLIDQTGRLSKFIKPIFNYVRKNIN
jgi:8-oxo-dGTP pyrophosphatase MutT (NUDIX family)